MASTTRVIVDEIDFHESFSAKVFDTDAVQIFVEDTQIATLSEFNENLRATPYFMEVLKSIQALYVSSPVEFAEGRGPARVAAVNYNHVTNFETLKAVYDSGLPSAEKFAVFYSAVTKNIPLTANDLSVIEPSLWHLTDFAPKSIRWATTFQNWLLPEMGVLKENAAYSGLYQTSGRFNDFAHFLLYVRLHNFVVSGSKDTFTDWLSTTSDANLRKHVSEDATIALKDLFFQNVNHDYFDLKSSVVRNLLEHFVSTETLPILAFQVERCEAGIIPFGSENSNLFNRKAVMTYSPKILTLDEHKKLAQYMSDTPHSVYRHFGYDNSRTQLAALILIAYFGPQEAEELINEIAGHTNGDPARSPAVSFAFGKRFRSNNSFKKLMDLKQYVGEDLPAAWLVSIAGLSNTR